jgi:hypothetical protein
VRVAVVLSDLLLFSRIESAARVAGVELARVDAPQDIPPDSDLVLVDWSARQPDWTDPLRSLDARVILFGPHTDLEAHAAARAAELGPMWARSKFVADLPSILQPDRTPSDIPRNPLTA